MKSLGICIVGKKVYFAEMSGTYETPKLDKQYDSTILSTSNCGELMDWFESEFNIKIKSRQFDVISYCISESASKSIYTTSIFPYAILNKIAFDGNLNLIEKSQLNFNNKKFKGKKITDECICKFNLPKTVKGKQRSILSAWCALPNA